MHADHLLQLTRCAPKPFLKLVTRTFRQILKDLPTFGVVQPEKTGSKSSYLRFSRKSSSMVMCSSRVSVGLKVSEAHAVEKRPKVEGR
jgi:hypothetical protein